MFKKKKTGPQNNRVERALPTLYQSSYMKDDRK